MSLSMLRSLRVPQTLSLSRQLHTSKFLFQEASKSSGSLFSDVTELQEQNSKKRDFSDSLQSMNTDENFKVSKVTVENDVKLQEYIGHKPTPATDKLLTPLKKQIYEQNVKQNGFFKNNQEITLDNGERYKLKLTEEEINVLEPSLYLKSYRIKHSVKKATVFLRLISGMNVHDAITQGQFHTKKIGREVSQMLQEGIKDAPELGLKPEELYISQIWSGSDGWWSRRVDPKGRGRTGIIHHPYIHVRAILKTPITKKRLAWEAEQKELRQKAKMQLPNEKLRFKLDGHYKW
ncbi:hypothetical protein BON22_3159 [Cyberlindnera fabianii]|uniref:54S ribosomal protein L22, mitochondrial n=1 Tax=Cyberlindnera fabianii TaxID=36022 RepID=A0A1V2L6V5_CYBFA|nr:hypothetical protein BON22_3159 [Cyberlindnera fabianii]